LNAETKNPTPRTGGDKWAANNFDFLTALSCMPFVPLGSAAAAVLRLMLMWLMANARAWAQY
jgi:hypothetical protein